MVEHKKRRDKQWGKWLLEKALVLFALLLTLPVIGLIGLALVTPVTIWGALYLLGLGLMAVALLSRSWRGLFSAITSPSEKMIGGAGVTLFLAVAIIRIAVVGGNPDLIMKTLPDGRDSRWLNRLIDERDVSLFALRPLLALGMVTIREMESIWPAFQEPYQTIQANEGYTPSAFLATYLGLQRPSAFDAIFIYPEGEQPPDTAVIFLHGFAGNFTMQCWLVGQAGRETGFLTVCPSTRWLGDWGSPQGRAITQATIAYLRQEGIERVYLAGLSNGGVGASQMASDLAELDGLILISGLSPAVEPAELPTFIIHSRQDERMPVRIARAYAEAANSWATYVEMDGDHFVLAKRPLEVREALVSWLLVQGE
jgi:hypothetical protein